ncbi:DUF2729 domain-containing protein [Actinobacillus indolicus]|uniref:DUF2729 domain-containing protein n=1 Tax=Actinobacillus indolicus TaxID=51049 RepID=A0A4P7CHG0_9PAST|nr:DUF2729 domain-containing protein [Actinobacillus indolicus]
MFRQFTYKKTDQVVGFSKKFANLFKKAITLIF